MKVIPRILPRMKTFRGLDLRSLAVAPVGIVAVILGQILDGGSVGSLVQGPAALIVFGGTCGAVLVSYTPREVLAAVGAAVRAFRRGGEDTAALAETMVGLAARSYRRGVLSLEGEIETLEDPFLRNGLTLAVDGTPLEVLREILTVERTTREADDEAPARVFEAAAGYAPTLGILGAVLGLIHVVEHLTSPGALGRGIATAFVATIYGVASANLVFLPIAGRLRERAAVATRRRALIVEGLCALNQRTNPRVVAQKLRVFANDPTRLTEMAFGAASNRPPQVSA